MSSKTDKALDELCGSYEREIARLKAEIEKLGVKLNITEFNRQKIRLDWIEGLKKITRLREGACKLLKKIRSKEGLPPEEVIVYLIQIAHAKGAPDDTDS